MFQVLPDTSQLPTVDVNFLNDYVLNPIIEQLDAGFDRLRATMNVGIGVCLTLAISEFAYALIIGAEQFAGGLRRLLGISVWLYIIRDYSHHAHALMNSLVNVGMAFGGGSGNWRETLNPSRIAAKGFELGGVLLDNMPNALTLDLGDILGVGIGFILIQACFAALVLNVGLLVIGFYMALPIAGFFSIFGLLSQTRGFAMRGITAIVSYGVHFALAALSLTLSESVIRGLHFSPEPTMHEIWSMVFIVMLLTVFAWWGPQRVAAAFMNGAVGVGGGEAAAIGAAVGGTAMAVATGAVGTAALGLDKIVQGLDNRPKDAAGGGGSGGSGGGAPRVSQSIQPAPAPAAAVAAPAQTASPTQAPAAAAVAGPNEPILVTTPSTQTQTSGGSTGAPAASTQIRQTHLTSAPTAPPDPALTQLPTLNVPIPPTEGYKWLP